MQNTSLPLWASKMTRLHRAAVIGGAALMAALLAAGPAAAARYTVVLKDMAFGPVPTELHVGDVIVWDNEDIFEHTATARDMSFDVDLPAGAKAETVMKKAGSIPFYCRFHPGMTGTLVVKP